MSFRSGIFEKLEVILFMWDMQARQAQAVLVKQRTIKIVFAHRLHLGAIVIMLRSDKKGCVLDNALHVVSYVHVM